MLAFQFYGGTFQNTLQYLQSWGFFDVVIPFALIFAVIYTALTKVDFLKDKNIRIVVALSISLMTVVPHVIGISLGGIDVVNVINQFLPETTLVVITLVVVLLLTGLIGGDKKNKLADWAPWGGLIIVGFLLLRAINPDSIPFLNQYALFNDTSFQGLIIAAAVFALIVYFVTGGSGDSDKPKGKEVKLVAGE